MTKYIVKLNEEQRQQVEELVRRGKAPARSIMHGHILLKSDGGEQGPGWSYQQIEEVFGVGETTIKEVRKRYVEEGLEAALHRRKQPERPEKRKINGRQEAFLIATVCTEKPEGRERWTIRALTTRIIELEIVEQVGRETVRMVLQNNKLKPWLKKYWCIAPLHDGKYVHNMEDVLDVYELPYNEKRPQICVDEGNMQLVEEKREPIPMKPDRVKKVDYEYERKGFCCLFLMIEPLTGKIVTQVKERRGKKDFAHFLKHLIDEVYPEAEKLLLVVDNLNTHHLGCLYDAFPPEEARRLAKKLEIHYTPVHGSWLNMAEIGLSVVGRQALSERMEDIETVKEKVEAWQAKRDKNPPEVKWRFTTKDARVKLACLYPEMEEKDAEKTTVE